MRSYLLFGLFVFGCGGGGSSGTDAGSDSNTDAPAIDAAAIDAPPGTGSLIANDGAANITQWTAPDTYPGTTTSGRLMILNAGTAPTGALTATLTGADAASFVIDSAGSTCGPTLVAGDGCYVKLSFSPTVTGPKSATLEVAGSGTSLSLPLVGNVPMLPSSGLVADMAMVDFGQVQHGGASGAQVIISNTSASSITIGPRTTTGAMFTAQSDNCPVSLTPGGACTVNLIYHDAPLGLSTGTFDVTSSVNALSVPLRGITLRKVTVTPQQSFGMGTVTSLPAGISCSNSQSCSAGFPLGVTVSLTATPDANNMFVAWSGSLCSGATCSIASPMQGDVYYQFVPTSAKKITIMFAGTGHSAVTVHSEGSMFGPQCFSDCVVYVQSGAQIDLVGASPSTFVGWSGDCTGTANLCSLGTVVNDRTVTIMSNLDPYEVASVFAPTGSPTGLAVLPNGNLVVATSTDVTALTLAGAIVWTTPMTGARSLAVDTAGHIYGLGGPGVFALSPTGTQLWTLTFTGSQRNTYSLESTVSVSPDGTVIAVLTDDGVHVVDGNGADRFTITGVTPQPQAVAVSPNGTVAIAIRYDVPAGTGNRQALRYSSTGVQLSTLAPIPGGTQISMMYDANENLAAATCTSTRFTTSATAPNNTTNFSAEDVLNQGVALQSGVAATPTSKVAGIRIIKPGVSPGLAVRAFSATGTVLLTRDKPAIVLPQYPYDDMLSPLHVTAGGGPNRIAIGGNYNNRAWLTVLDLP